MTERANSRDETAEPIAMEPREGNRLAARPPKQASISRHAQELIMAGRFQCCVNEETSRTGSKRSTSASSRWWVLEAKVGLMVIVFGSGISSLDLGYHKIRCSIIYGVLNF